jgi:hypothetical protein
LAGSSGGNQGRLETQIPEVGVPKRANCSECRQL